MVQLRSVYIAKAKYAQDADRNWFSFTSSIYTQYTNFVHFSWSIAMWVEIETFTTSYRNRGSVKKSSEMPLQITSSANFTHRIW